MKGFDGKLAKIRRLRCQFLVKLLVKNKCKLIQQTT